MQSKRFNGNLPSGGKGRHGPFRHFPGRTPYILWIAVLGSLSFHALWKIPALTRLGEWVSKRLPPSTVNTVLLPAATPWATVGGCGVGGSGGTASNIKWIGKGVSGGLMDLQFMYSKNIGQNFLYDTYQTRLSGNFNWSNEWGVTFPIVHKIGPLQAQTNVEEEAGHIVGGIGDLSVDYTKVFGVEGEFGLLLSLTMPTGQYDIMRGKDNAKQFLPVSLQKGGGVYSGGVTLNYTRDLGDGLWLAELGYSWPFAFNWQGKNQRVKPGADNYNEVHDRWDLLASEDKERFEYYFKPYGENDLGGFTPQSVNASLFYGYRGQEGFVHSIGAAFSVPLGVAWIPDFVVSNYNPKPDPDHRMWTGSLTYGLEISRRSLPVFLAVSKTFQDKTNPPGPNDDPYYDPYDKPFGEKIEAFFDGADWEDFLQSWAFAVGIKAALF